MNIMEIKKNPAKHYDAPDDVVADDALDTAQKREILKQWEVDAELLSVADAENMTGGDSPQIDLVRKAIRSLDK